MLLSLLFLTLAATFSMISQTGVAKFEMIFIRVKVHRLHRFSILFQAYIQTRPSFIQSVHWINEWAIWLLTLQLISIRCGLIMLWICRFRVKISSLEWVSSQRMLQKPLIHIQLMYNLLNLRNMKIMHSSKVQLISQLF